MDSGSGLGRPRHSEHRARAGWRLRPVRLGSLRANPYHASHNFEGFTHRNLVTPTFLVSRTGKAVDFSSTTGWVWWKTEDATDLDYTPLPLITRDNNEKDLQFTQEFRFASAKNVSVALADNLAL